MIIRDLLFNLSLLASLSILSGFIESRFDRHTTLGKILQGILFGGVTIIGMLYPFNFSQGIIFDGRSIVISLCALFFGPVSGAVASAAAITFRGYLGGSGTFTGILTIAGSFIIGYLFYWLREKRKIKLTKLNLYLFGFAVNLFMLFIFITLPQNLVNEAYRTIALTVIVFYPVITLVIGKVLLDQKENKNFLERINQEKSLYHTTLYSIGDAVISTDSSGRIITMNPVAEKLVGWTEREAINVQLEKVFKIINEYSREKVENPVRRVLKEGIIVGLANHTILISKDGKEIPVADSAAPIKDKNGNIKGVVLVFRDQTEERESRRIVEESEQRLKRAELISKSGNWELHLNENKLIGSLGACRIYGIDQNNFSLSELQKIPLPQYREPLNEALKRLIEDDQLYDIEFKIKAVDTEEIKHIHSMGFYDKDKNIVFGVLHDITERKAAEEALKQSEEKFRKIFHEHSAVKLLIDFKTGNIVDANKAASEFYGWSIEELKEKNIAQINLLSHEKIKEKMEAIKNLERTYFELQHKRADGSIRNVEVYSSQVRINGSDFIHGIVHDVTDKKRAEKELRKTSLAVEQSPVSIIITDKLGNIEYVNPIFTDITGYTFEEAVKIGMPLLKPKEQSEEFHKEIWETILAGGKWSGVLHNKKKNGECFWESAVISPIKNESGEIINILIIKEDISEKIEKELELKKYKNHLEELVAARTNELDNVNEELLKQLNKEKELEAQLEESLSKEKEINDLKTKFIATVSHEFRTPLAALLSSTQLIQRYSNKWSEEKLNEHYLRISSTIQYLTELLDDVLTISRADRDILKSNPEPIEIETFIKSFLDEIKVHFSSSHDIIFNNLFDRKIIVTDKKLFRHIIINLLANAVKYSPQGGPVELILKNDKDKINVIVSDHGIGIPADELKHIFNAFYRAKNSIGIQGTGLGLNITKRALEILGGTISINTELNKGTTFTVKFPIND